MGISFLTILVFYLPSDSGEKVSFIDKIDKQIDLHEFKVQSFVQTNNQQQNLQQTITIMMKTSRYEFAICNKQNKNFPNFLREIIFIHFQLLLCFMRCS